MPVQTQIDPQESRLKLHTALTANNFDVGEYKDFNIAMDDPTRRQKFYEQVTANNFDIGTMEEFESKMGSSGIPERAAKSSIIEALTPPLVRSMVDTGHSMVAGVPGTLASGKSFITQLATMSREQGMGVGAIDDFESVREDFQDQDLHDPQVVNEIKKKIDEQGGDPTKVSLTKKGEELKISALKNVKTAIKIRMKGAVWTEGMTKRLEDIDDFGSAIDWMSIAIGQAVVQIPAAYVTGGLSIIPQEVGSIYVEQVERIAEKNNITVDEVIKNGMDEPAYAIAYGLAASSLERFGMTKVMSAFSKNMLRKSFLKEGKKALLKKTGTVGTAGATEFITEGSQTILEIAGREQLDPLEVMRAASDPNHEWHSEIKNASAMGLVGGTSLSAVGTIVSKELDAVNEKDLLKEDIRVKLSSVLGEELSPNDPIVTSVLEQGTTIDEIMEEQSQEIEALAKQSVEDTGEVDLSGEPISATELADQALTDLADSKTAIGEKKKVIEEPQVVPEETTPVPEVVEEVTPETVDVTKPVTKVDKKTGRKVNKETTRTPFEKKDMRTLKGKDKNKETRRRSLFGKVEQAVRRADGNKRSVASAVKTLEDIITKYSKEYPELAKRAKEEIAVIQKAQLEKTKIAVEEGIQKKAEQAVQKALKKVDKESPTRVETIWNSIKDSVPNIKTFNAVVEQINKKIANSKGEPLTDKEARQLRAKAKSSLSFRGKEDISTDIRKKIKTLLKKPNDPNAKIDGESVISYLGRINEALSKHPTQAQLEEITPEDVKRATEKLNDAKDMYFNMQMQALRDGKYEIYSSEEFEMLGFELIDYLPKASQESILEEIRALEKGVKSKRKQFLEGKKKEMDDLRLSLLPLLLDGDTVVPPEGTKRSRELKKKFRFRRTQANQYTLYFDTFGNIMDYLGNSEKNVGVRETLFNKEFSKLERKARIREIVGQRKWNTVLMNNFVEIFMEKSPDKLTNAQRRELSKIYDSIAKKDKDNGMIKFVWGKDAGEYVGVKEELTASLDEVLNYWMQLQSEHGKNALEAEGKDKDFERAINEIMDENLKLKEYGTFLLEDFYPSYFPGLDAAYRARTGMPLIRTENYSPLVREPKGTEGKSIKESLETWHPITSALNSYLKPRVGKGESGPKVMQLGAINMAGKYVVANEHFKAYDGLVTKMQGVFGNSSFQRALKIRFGDGKRGNKSHIINILDLKIQHLAHGRIMHLFADTLMDKIRTNIVMASIGFIPNLAIKQATSLVGYSAEMPKMPKGVGKSYAGYMLEFFRNPVKNGRRLFKDNPFLRERLNRGNRSFDETLININKTKQLFGERVGRRKLEWYSMGFIRMGDIGAIIIGGYPVYRAYYDKAISQNKTPEQAKDIAQLEYMDVTLNTQQSGEVADMPMVKHNAIGRLVTSFASTPIQYGSNVRAGIRASRRSTGRNRNMGAYRAAMYGLLLPYLFQAAAQSFKFGYDDDDDDDRTLLNRWLFAPISNFFGSFGYLDYLFEGVARKTILGEDFGYGSTVLDSFSESLGKSIEIMYTLAYGDEDDKEAIGRDIVLPILQAVSMWHGIPLSNAAKLGFNTMDVIQSEELESRDAYAKLLGYSDWALNIKVKPSNSSAPMLGPTNFKNMIKVQQRPRLKPKPKPKPN